MIILKVPIVILIIAVVTLQTFTRGKSFYLGKISLGKFTSGFIFPMLKGHNGENLDFGRFNVTNNHILARVFKILAQENFGAKWKTCSRTNESKRGFYYFIAVHYFISKSNTSKTNFIAVPDFSKDSKTTKSRI